MSQLVIALAMFLAVAAGAESGAVTFPGSLREIRSPDSAYTIVWWEPDASDSGHSLLLKAPYTPKTWKVYSFTRSVTVSWAPSDSSSL
jgi:hypothetical protein